MSEKCIGCGKPLPESVFCSISHTIEPGRKICSDCGQRETLDPVWAEGRRVAWIRTKAALGVKDKLKRRGRRGVDGTT